jgi:hypothetical protein
LFDSDDIRIPISSAGMQKSVNSGGEAADNCTRRAQSVHGIDTTQEASTLIDASCALTTVTRAFGKTTVETSL